MIKSSTPVWVLIFSFLFGFERPSLKLVGVISFIVFGVWLTIDGEPKFDTKGFILVLTAAVASGLRWNMAQYLMKPSKSNKNNSPLATMYHLSPIMFITMLSLSLVIEKPFQQQDTATANFHFDSVSKSIISLGIMSFGGVLGTRK